MLSSIMEINVIHSLCICGVCYDDYIPTGNMRAVDEKNEGVKCLRTHLKMLTDFLNNKIFAHT